MLEIGCSMSTQAREVFSLSTSPVLRYKWRILVYLGSRISGLRANYVTRSRNFRSESRRNLDNSVFAMGSAWQPPLWMSLFFCVNKSRTDSIVQCLPLLVFVLSCAKEAS